MSVLIISQDWVIQNVVSQLVITYGYPSIMTAIMQEADAKLAQPRRDTWAMIVIDAEVFSEAGAIVSHEALHRLQTWSERRPGLSLVYLGDVLQKYALLAADPAFVPFVTLPVSPHDLMQTLRPLLPNGGELLPISFPPMRPV